jgi:hypothetical protein
MAESGDKVKPAALTQMFMIHHKFLSSQRKSNMLDPECRPHPAGDSWLAH